MILNCIEHPSHFVKKRPVRGEAVGTLIFYFTKLATSRENYVDNNTWARGDMEFLFECSTRYLTSERSEWVRYRIEHEKRNSISPSNHVLLCLLYKHKSPQYYWNNFYLRATAVSVEAKDKSDSCSTHSNKQFSNTFINTIENFSLLFYFHAIITTLYCFICPYSLVDNLKSPYLLAPD